MRVLYVNHTATISGGEHSLLELLAALPATVQPLLASPPGPLQAAAIDLGVPVASIAAISASLRLHPVHTPRALGELALAAAGLRRLARRHRAELVHANSIRAGVVLGLTRLPRAARVVHVRDALPPGALTSASMRLLAATATIIVANSRYTARSVLAAAPKAAVEVVHNAVDLTRWDPARVDRAAARKRLGAAGGRLLLGVVAQLSPWKGQQTAIETLRLLCDGGIDAHLLLIGSAKFTAPSTRFDNERYVDRLHELVSDAGLGERVSWLGEREDVPELVGAMDILLLPSWEEPFGRALIEAMAMGVPVIATSVGGPAEIIEDGREGYLLAPREPEAWAQAVRRIAASAELARELGRAGRRRVEQEFTIARHVEAMLDLYERALLSRSGSRHGRRRRSPR
jgi:glycosyltransferase involved in cell wall biosynthesis